MRRNLFSLFAVMSMMGCFVACEDSDLPGLGKEANTTFSGDNLVLTYGGSTMSGKQITFHTYDGETATIEMSGVLDLSTLLPSYNLPDIGMLAPGVIPGEVQTQLSNVPLTLSTDGTSYSFSGTDTSNDRELIYSGEVSADKMTMNVQVKMPADGVQGTWSLPVANAIAMVWESEGTIDILGQSMPTSTVASLVGTLVVSPMIAERLQSLVFHEDGNVVASYMKSGASTWQDSPLNLVQYYVKGEKLYAQLNASAIISLVMQTRASNISDIISMLPSLISYLSEGIPLNYEKATDGTLRLTLATDDVKTLLNLLTLDIISEQLISALPENAQSIVQPIVEKLPDLLSSTTTLEISLTLNPA